METKESLLLRIAVALEGINAKLGVISHNQLQTVATPVIACEDNEVTITCATSDAAIHYTSDGSEPTAESDVYSAAIAITATKTFKAIAMKLDMNDSAVASAVCEYVAPEPEPEPGE